MLSPLNLLDALLNTPPRFIFTHRDTFTGRCTGTERIRSHRYIRILRGALSYTIEDTEARLGAGVVLFVPRGALRHWEVPAGNLCEILWCEFDTPGLSPDPHTLYFADDSARALEKASLERLAKLWTFPRHLRAGSEGDPGLPRETALLMEGELKASMARFWTAAQPWGDRQTAWPRGPDRIHPTVRKALAWMEENFRLPDAQSRLLSQAVDLSPGHFRLLFGKQVGSSITAHLHRLRMREAMSLLRTTSLSIKEIAAMTGFNDPLYFSKRFHEHWDIAPTSVRK